MNKIQIPWEERPVGCTDVMWRYSQNPVIGRYHIPSSNSIFNSAVVPFKDGFAGVFRCDNKAVQMNIFTGFSKDIHLHCLVVTTEYSGKSIFKRHYGTIKNTV